MTIVVLRIGSDKNSLLSWVWSQFSSDEPSHAQCKHLAILMIFSENSLFRAGSGFQARPCFVIFEMLSTLPALPSVRPVWLDFQSRDNLAGYRFSVKSSRHQLQLMGMVSQKSSKVSGGSANCVNVSKAAILSLAFLFSLMYQPLAGNSQEEEPRSGEFLFKSRCAACHAGLATSN